MMIANTKRYLRGLQPQDKLSNDHLNAFQMSEALAIATGKLKEDIIIDLTKD